MSSTPDGPRASGEPSPASALAREKRYYDRIQNRLIALREGGFIVSPRDFEILRDWFERGVPAELVIATLEEVFARKADRPESRRPWTIAYCRRAVERAWEERRAALLGTVPADSSRGSAPGTSGAFRKDQIAAHLAAVAETTRTAASRLPDARGRGALSEVAERLAALGEAAASSQGPGELPALEAELVALEERAVAVGRERLAGAELDALGAKAAQDLAGVSSKMSAKAREATLRRAVDAAVRRRLGLGRFSLFTMTT